MKEPVHYLDCTGSWVNIGFRLLAQTAAAVAGIRERADADAGDGAYAVSRAVTHHGCERTLGDVPAFDLVLGKKFAHIGIML